MQSKRGLLKEMNETMAKLKVQNISSADKMHILYLRRKIKLKFWSLVNYKIYNQDNIPSHTFAHNPNTPAVTEAWKWSVIKLSEAIKPTQAHAPNSTIRSM